MVVFAIFLLALCACQQTRKVDLETRPVVRTTTGGCEYFDMCLCVCSAESEKSRQNDSVAAVRNAASRLV